MSAVDEVKARLDIVEVVSQYVPLQKSGRNFRALCPFHSEVGPSFYVYPESQSWHCFGRCGEGGDVFSFVMKKEGLSFGEALRLLAQRAGVALPSRRSPEEEERLSRLYAVNEAAAQFYHHLLLKGEAAARARDYVALRGLSTRTVEVFQLGYSPDSWDALRQHLESRGFQVAEQLQAGLLAQPSSRAQAEGGEDGRTYDRFRGRLIFPIRDPQGRVIGFGGRVLDESMPKYLNSPQTPLFDKSSVLYGLDLARAFIRQQDLAIVAEGYMDVVKAHQTGVTNMVACLGTAITEKQVTQLKGLTKHLALALDADAAGEEATLRALQGARRIFEERMASTPTWRGDTVTRKAWEGEVKIISLPPGQDPDDVLSQGPEAWEGLAKEALPVIEYIFRVVLSQADLADPRSRSEAVRRLLPLLEELSDPVAQGHYVQRLARLAQVGEDSLVEALRRPRRRAQEAEHPEPSEGTLERFVLSLLLRYPELRERGLALAPEELQGAANREIFLAWREEAEAEGLRQRLDESLRPLVEALTTAFLPQVTSAEVGKALEEALRRLRERGLKLWEAKRAELLAEMEGGGQARELAELAFSRWRGDDVPHPEPDLERGVQVQLEGLGVHHELRELFAQGKTEGPRETREDGTGR